MCVLLEKVVQVPILESRTYVCTLALSTYVQRIAGKDGVELKLVVSFSTAKAKPIKYISIFEQSCTYYQI